MVQHVEHAVAEGQTVEDGVGYQRVQRVPDVGDVLLAGLSVAGRRDPRVPHFAVLIHHCCGKEPEPCSLGFQYQIVGEKCKIFFVYFAQSLPLLRIQGMSVIVITRLSQNIRRV